LTRVRETGDWESWIEFFLTGVKETSEQAVAGTRRILALLDADRRKIDALGRPAASVLRVFQYAQTNPILSVATTAASVGVSFPTVTSAVTHLQNLGVLREITGRQRRRLFVYEAYLKILNEGTEPLR
jgi:Fic family protein